MKLFDSSVLVAHLRGDTRATGLLAEAVADDEACCSVLSRIEIEGGMRSALRDAVHRLFAAMQLVTVSEPIAVADLITLNVKQFPMVKGLRPAFR